MSSEGSISTQSSGSPIRQFGLYRTIDARTEEFLRLSRKRQIRQGCACAAASTAITVTVVVVIFFVYEFSLNSEINLENSLKTNWLSLMNDTSDNSVFDSKYREDNIIDETTLKLLPLLIKSIKKNAYLDKLLEDNQNTNNSNEKREATETILDKKTFTQNWLKFPTTKLYAIEYKTSPVVYYKSPTENIEYYTKIRKIRDHQRIFNYVDKMISEKVYIGATRPIFGSDHNNNINSEKPPVTVKDDNLVKEISLQSSSKFKNVSQNKSNITDAAAKECKCPYLRTILNKILTGIQNVLPETKTKTSLRKAQSLDRRKPIDPGTIIGTKLQNLKIPPLTEVIHRSLSDKRGIKTNRYVSASINSNYKQQQHDNSKLINKQEKFLNKTKLHDLPPEFEDTTRSKSSNRYKSMTTRHDFSKKSIKDVSDENRINLNIFGLNNGASSLRPNYVKTNMGRQMGILKDKLKKGKKTSTISDVNFVKKYMKSVTGSNYKNIMITSKHTKQLLDKKSKEIAERKFPLDDKKFILDFLKAKLEESLRDDEDIEKCNIEQDKSKLNTPKEKSFSLKGNKTTMTPGIHNAINKTENVNKPIPNQMNNVFNNYSLDTSNEVKSQINETAKIKFQNTSKKQSVKPEGESNEALKKFTDKDIELMAESLAGHTKFPEYLIDRAVEKLLKKNYSFDVEWEDVDIDVEPSLVTGKPKQHRSSYLQIARTEGKNYELNDDEFSDHIYYENIINNIV